MTARQRRPGDVLHLRGVIKRYGDLIALDEVTLAVGAGEVVGLLGPNGAGKTTTQHLALGLLRPNSGTIELLGEDPRRSRGTMRRKIGFASQEVALYDTLTIEENIRYWAEVAGVERGRLNGAVRDAVADYDLESVSSRRVSDCSGGEQRRAHVAAALVHNPQFALLDEPTAGMDVEARRNLLQRLRTFANGGMAILLSSHYLAELEELCDRIVILANGRVKAAAPLSELVAGRRQGFVVLEFDDPVSASRAALLVGADVEGKQSSFRVLASNVRVDLPRIIQAIGTETGHLRGVDVVREGLEAIYLELTADGKAMAVGS